MSHTTFETRVVSAEKAREILAIFADANGVVKVEDKLGGARHEARLCYSRATRETPPIESAIQYVTNSPASVFAVNVTIIGSRGRCKVKVPDRMFIAFYTKAAILAGLNKFGPAFTIHTNCVTFHRVGAMEMGQTFMLPICAVECDFALSDIPADHSRPTAPYAKFWETYISTTLHGHNVANLKNSRYDMRLEFVGD